jgi:hypothetical protein
MRGSYAWLTGLSLLAVNCSKKGDADPAIPANSIQLTDNGQLVSFDFAKTTAVLETNAQGQKQLTINAATTADDHRISLNCADRQGVEVPRTYAGPPTPNGSTGSAYTLAITNYATNCRPVTMGTLLYQFYSASATPDFQLTVQAVDATQHTFRGTFSGTYTLGCDSRQITEGRFNLPYTVKP